MRFSLIMPAFDIRYPVEALHEVKKCLREVPNNSHIHQLLEDGG